MKQDRHTRSTIDPENDYDVGAPRPGLDAFTVLMVGIGIVALITGPVMGLYSIGIGFAGLAGACIVALFPRLDHLTVLLLGAGILGVVIGPVLDFYSWGLGAVVLISALLLVLTWRVYLAASRSRG